MKKTTLSFSLALKSSAAVKVSLLILSLTLFAQGSTQKKETSEPATGYRLRFGEQLGLSQDLQLCGSSDSRQLRFYSEARWKPSSGSRLHLILDHSANLDGDRSFLSVVLNYGVLRSLRLDEQNERQSEVVISLPPESLRRENEFVFSVTQFPHDPAGGRPCTSIKLDSYIEIPYSEGESTLDLSLFPTPFVDPYSYRPQKLSLLVPSSKASTATLQAIALMAANLAQQAGSQQLQIILVRTIDSAEVPLIVIGTLQEQPELRELLGQSHLAIERGGAEVLAGSGGDSLGESEGLVGVAAATRGRRRPILFVTGNSPVGVLTAVRQMLGGSTKPKGAVAKISETSLPQRKGRRDWAGFIPPSGRFRLSDLTEREVRVGTVVGQSGVVHLDAPPDAQFLNYGHEMNLVIRLVSEGKPPQNLTVKFNDTLIGKFASQQLFTGPTASVTVEVPARLLGLRNTLKVGWEGGTENTGPAVALLPTSEFYLPRAYRTELPDLALLQHNLYPFSLYSDFQDLAIVIPDLPPADSAALLTEMACVLGRLAPSEFLNFQVRRTSEVSRAEMGTFNIILLTPEIAGNSIQSLFGRWQPLPWIDSLKRYSRVQEQVSPWNSSKWVLLFEANSVPALQEAVRLCFSNNTLKQLTGDSAVLLTAGPVSFAVARKQIVEEELYLMRLEVWMREHWVALPIVLTLMSAVLFVGLRVVLGNYRRAQTTRTSVETAT